MREEVRRRRGEILLSGISPRTVFLELYRVPEDDPLIFLYERSARLVECFLNDPDVELSAAVEPNHRKWLEAFYEAAHEEVPGTEELMEEHAKEAWGRLREFLRYFDDPEVLKRPLEGSPQ